MYYARGCSSLMWDCGRTFVARDRLQAMLRAHMLAVGCNATCAVSKVVGNVMQTTHAKSVFGKHRSAWPPDLESQVRRACETSLGLVGREGSCPHRSEGVGMTLAGADLPTTGTRVRDGATRRRFAARPRTAHPRPPLCVPDRRLRVHPPCAGSLHLDLYLGPLVRQHGYDSVTLLFQPKGGANAYLKWHTELWDVRDLRFADVVEGEIATGADVPGNGTSPDTSRGNPVAAPTRTLRHFLRCHGAPCVPSAEYRGRNGAGCLECAGCDTGCARASAGSDRK